MGDITVKAGETLVIRSTVTLDMVEGTRTVTDVTYEVLPADPKPPTLREQVAKEVGDIVRLAVPLVSHDAPEWDAEQADAVLAVVADWLAAQPLMDKNELYAIAEKRPVTRDDQRNYDVRLIATGGES